MTTPQTSLITCTCTVCNGRQARVRGDGQMTPTMRHNVVQIAHSPLARTASAIQHGPWKV